MSRPLSNSLLAAVYAESSGDVLVPILKLTASGMSAVRVVRNGTSVTHNSETYEPLPFMPLLPDDTEDANPILSMRIDNVLQDVMAELRSATSEITGRVTWIRTDDPDTAQIGPITGIVRAIRADAFTITGSMQGSPVYEAPISSSRMGPAAVPGLF